MTRCGACEPHVSPKHFYWVKMEDESEPRKVFQRFWQQCSNEASHQHVKPFGASSFLVFDRCEQHRSW